MRLFLLLSALLASLTGLVAGAPAQARAGEPAAITAALNPGSEHVRAAVQVRSFPADWTRGAKERGALRAVDQVAPHQLHAVDERRRE